MHSYIISSSNLEKGTEKAKEISQKEKVDVFDLEIAEFEGLGIEDIRKIQEKIFLKPFRGEKKSLIIVISGNATTEAQNAMLKLLEEPPKSSLIFIVINNYLSLLPTILSRAKVIELTEEIKTTGESLSEFLEMQKDGNALYLAEKIAKDKSAILWLEDLILSLREKMIENLDNKNEANRIRRHIHKIELGHYDLKNTNANPRLILENLFLELK